MAETCEQCGCPLASDQRYCLECGQRRAGPRVDYRHYMAGPAQPSEPDTPADSPPPGEEPEKIQRDYAPLAAVGGIAVLGLMLLVGVLIGKGNSDTASAPPPQVVRIQGGEGEEGQEGSGRSKGGAGLGGAGKTNAKKAGRGGSTGTGNAVKPSTDELQAHSNASGESYEKESENLPNEIATPGKPPPIDTSKPPGGGEGGAEVIK